MTDKIDMLEKFSVRFYGAVDEIEAFIPELPDLYNKQQVLSLKRRCLFLQEEAEKAGVDLLVKLLRLFIEYLNDSFENYYGLTVIVRVILDSFKLALNIICLESRGEDVPGNYAEMILDSFMGVFIHCNNNGVQKFENRIKTWVLIVDDEESIRAYVEDVLFSSGYLILSATNGRQAISLASTRLFSIIFTDINMPYKSGYDLLYYAQENNIDADILVFTGFSSAKSVSKAIHGGAYDYIGKPFNGSDDILNAAERAMQHRRLVEKNKKLMSTLQENNLKLHQYVEGMEEALRSLEEKNQELIRAERMATIGVLVAGLAHEINNPNTFIRGNIQTLQRFWGVVLAKITGSKPEKGVEKLDYIIEQMPGLLEGMFEGTERVANITRGLKAFARVENVADKMELCDVRELLDAALNILENKISKQVMIEKNIEQVPKVFVARPQLIEALVNVIRNSLDAVKGLKVQLVTIKVYASNDGVILEINDNGCGIREDAQDKIFDPFFTTKPVDKGTGLGLSIAEGVISAQGGWIRLARSDSEGTSFEIFLPSSHGALKNNLPVVLMFADNSPAFRAFEAGIMAVGNYNLINVSGDCDSIDARLDEMNPELVIMDIKWGALSGKELFESIKKIIARNIRIICVVDGWFDKHREKELYELGVDKVLVLPCSLAHLLELLRELIGL